MSSQEAFRNNKYLLLPKLVNQDTCRVLQAYALGLLKLGPESGYLQDPQCPLSLAKYADPAMEALLSAKQNEIESRTGLSLFPTYSYFRIYSPNDELKPHRDRPACEISCTVCLGKFYKEPQYHWPILMESTPLELEVGDGAVYRGLEVTHSRPPFHQPNGSWHLQVFLHYVDANGSHVDQKYDKRASLFRSRAASAR